MTAAKPPLPPRSCCRRHCPHSRASLPADTLSAHLLRWQPPGPAGGCDNGVKMWNLGSNQQQQVAQHAAPIRHCFFLPRMNMLVTGSWDKTVKYWDLRSANPVHTQQMPDRVYAMDVQEELLVVGTADRQIQVRRRRQWWPWRWGWQRPETVG